MSTQNSPASFHDIIAFSFFNLSIAISFFFYNSCPLLMIFFCLLNQREMFSEIQKRSLEGETISLYYNKQFFFLVVEVDFIEIRRFECCAQARE